MLLRHTGSAPATTFLVLCLASLCSSNHDARRLYDDLLRKNRYNRLIRPVGNSTDILTVKMGLKLAQVLDVVSDGHSFHACARMHERIQACANTRKHARTHARTHTHAHTRTNTRTVARTRGRTHAYTHAHTHAHTVRAPPL